MTSGIKKSCGLHRPLKLDSASMCIGLKKTTKKQKFNVTYVGVLYVDAWNMRDINIKLQYCSTAQK